MQDKDKSVIAGKSREFGHVHGVVDPAIINTERGIWAIKWSFYALLPAAIFQLVIVLFSGSVSLFADSIHNFGDVATAIPLWIAFILALKSPNKTFTYGYGKFEDLAGVAIVIIILISAIFSGYESIIRFFHPQMLENLWAIALAAIVGFLGNEIVSIFRIRVGKEISSASLIADGYHARADGFTSLSVLIGVIGVYLGFPIADPIIGIIITILLFRIVWKSGKSVFTRLLDGIDPEVVDNIRDALTHVPEVQNVSEVRVRWLGHRLEAEINLSVDPKLSVEEGHEIAKKAQKHLLYHLKYLSYTTIHIDPTDASGEEYHK
jgi:cation diffusion facilitator family transporter